MYDYDAASARFFFFFFVTYPTRSRSFRYRIFPSHTWQYLAKVCLFLPIMVVYTIPHLQVSSLDHICQSYDPLGPLPVGVMPQRDIALILCGQEPSFSWLCLRFPYEDAEYSIFGAANGLLHML